MEHLKRNRSTNAFTLIEMMVVTGMLAILMGVAFSGIGQARNQARVAKANTEVRELVNAILSYEAANEELDVAPTGTEATEGNIQKLLGLGGSKTVYLNAPMVRGAFRDPWGTPYKYRVVEARVDDDRTTVSASVTFPNRQREVRW